MTCRAGAAVSSLPRPLAVLYMLRVSTWIEQDVTNLRLNKFRMNFSVEILRNQSDSWKKPVGKCGKFPKKSDLFLRRNNCYSDW
jgi:hypothetical protein